MENNWSIQCTCQRYDHDTENKLLLKEKETYEKVVAERNNEISTLNKKLNMINLGIILQLNIGYQ